jgi:hypothetical protein
MIWVRVSDHDAVNPAKRDTGMVHALQQGFPRRLPREARVHQGKTEVILERIGVDVSQACVIDRELQAQDSRYDLHDLRRGVLLFLLFDPRGCRRTGFRVRRCSTL